MINEANIAYSIGHLVSAVYFLEFFNGGKGAPNFVQGRYNTYRLYKKKESCPWTLREIDLTSRSVGIRLHVVVHT